MGRGACRISFAVALKDSPCIGRPSTARTASPFRVVACAAASDIFCTLVTIMYAQGVSPAGRYPVSSIPMSVSPSCLS
jgi:hypothetical protein|eukprot:COSAG01_NODE_13165_length_1625_cov_187.290957_2_plen_78_part_00